MRKRSFLLGGALALGGLGLWGRSSSIDLSDLAIRPKLTLPPLLDTMQSKSFALTAMAGSTAFVPGGATPTAGFNQAYLGPVVRLSQGDVRATVSNTLEMDVSTHWHGMLFPGETDGGPHQLVASGGKWQPDLNVDQPPCTGWFHTHVHGGTATGVYSGLAGGLIVSDGRDDDRGLPSTYGVDDLYLVLQDKQFSADGQMVYGTDMMSRMHGFAGDTIVVNGQVGSVAEVPKGIVRLRLLNGCNARIFRLAMSDGKPLNLIATDGGYLSQPMATDRLRLAPGERAEVLVDFGDGRHVALVSQKDLNRGPGAMVSQFHDIGASIIGGDFEVLAFAPSDDTGRIRSLEVGLDGSVPHLNDEHVAETRQFSLDMAEMGGGPMAINGRPFDHSRIDFETVLGSVERWTITASEMAHPFHVHGVSFQVESENGDAPRLENTGWKDTVLVDGEVTLLMKFTKPASQETPFMYHCHILEHEDAGMMGQFVVG